MLVVNSFNPGFVNLGLKLGKEKLFQYIYDFGFGSKTNVDLNGESLGILFDLDKVTDLNLATTSFGQGISVTPIQQVTAVSAVVNGGKLLKPYIVKSISEPETNSVIKYNTPQVIKNVISKSTSDKVKSALESVVANGTGRNAYIENYRVGGKTGTAQKVQNGHYLTGNYITSFIGFLPADNPEVVVYIAIDNAKGITQYGGTVAAPIAKSVMEDIISILDIEPNSGLKKEYFWYDIKSYDVPNTIGMSLKEAKQNLKKFNIEYNGTGNKVIYQTPSEGSLKENGTVRIYLGD